MPRRCHHIESNTHGTMIASAMIGTSVQLVTQRDVAAQSSTCVCSRRQCRRLVTSSGSCGIVTHDTGAVMVLCEHLDLSPSHSLRMLPHLCALIIARVPSTCAHTSIWSA